MTRIFENYIASVGPYVPISESRKNCQLNINLHVPQGWSYSVASFDYRGYVQLAPGQVAEQKSIYYFSGEANQVSDSFFYGPVAKDYLTRDNIGFQTLVWSSCNAVEPLNVSSQVSITGDFQRSGEITTDSIDGKFSHRLGLIWRRCR